MFLIFTGFLAAAYALQVPKGYSQENLILGLVYAWFSLYMFFTYAPKSIVTRPWMFLVRTAGKPIMALPQRWRTLLYGFSVFAIIVVTVFAIDESPESNRIQRLIALFGVLVFLVALYASSTVSC
jgi:CNT family concentrative nucleoside transporter